MNPIEETLKLIGKCHDFIERLPGQESRLAETAMRFGRRRQGESRQKFIRQRRDGKQPRKGGGNGDDGDRQHVLPW